MRFNTQFLVCKFYCSFLSKDCVSIAVKALLRLLGVLSLQDVMSQWCYRQTLQPQQSG